MCSIGLLGFSDDRLKPLRDGQRVLECLQKALRIASSSIEEIVSVQLYCDALDHYVYYFERQVKEVCMSTAVVESPHSDTFQVTARYVNSLVELITSNIDSIAGTDVYPSPRAPPGLIEGVHTASMITRHFKNTLLQMRARIDAASDEETPNTGADWEQIDIVGALLKMGLSR